MEKLILIPIMVLFLMTSKVSAQVVDPEVDEEFQFFMSKIVSWNQKEVDLRAVVGGKRFINTFLRLCASDKDDFYPYRYSYEKLTPYKIQDLQLWYNCYRQRISKDLLNDVLNTKRIIIYELSHNIDPDTAKLAAENDYLSLRLKRRGIYPIIFPLLDDNDTLCNISKQVYDYFQVFLIPLQQEFDKIPVFERHWDKDSVRVNRANLEIAFITEVLSGEDLYNSASDTISRINFDFIKDWMVEGLCDIKYSVICQLSDYYKTHHDITKDDIASLRIKYGNS